MQREEQTQSTQWLGGPPGAGQAHAAILRPFLLPHQLTQPSPLHPASFLGASQYWNYPTGFEPLSLPPAA